MSKSDNKKLLISWVAYHNDFEVGAFKPGGPNGEVLSSFSDEYDVMMLLLPWEEEDMEEMPKTHAIKTFLKMQVYRRKVEMVFLPITDPVDVNEIRGKLEAFLQRIKNDQADIFVSPGTPQMQIAWYLIHMFWDIPVRLFQTRKNRYRKNAKVKREYIDVVQSSTTSSVVIRQEQSAPEKSEYLMDTSSLIPVYSHARKIAYAEKATCLVYGETGTGKEHLARYIHEHSSRAPHAFVAINCSALSDQLLESRLFGYKRGAFTGADKDTIGYFEFADKGTIFLDEIGDVTPYMQQLLLRVLQEGTIAPIGDNVTRSVDVRIIAATHRDLVQLCEEGKFRWDLYYRLAVAEIELPSLRQRGKAEVHEYLTFFLKKVKKDFGAKSLLELSPEVKDLLLQYPYPGNIRELENLIQRLYIHCDQKVQLQDLPARFKQQSSSFSWNLEAIEKAHLLKALNFFEWNKSKVCQAVGYKSINTLYKKMKDYQIEPPSIKNVKSN